MILSIRKLLFRPARLAFALLIAAALCSCGVFRPKPYVDEAVFKANPPRTLAVLPTTDVTDHAWLAEGMRRSLFSAVAPLSYQDRALKEIDEFLARKAARLQCRPEQLPPEEMVDPRLADCLLYSQIEDVGRFYLIFYAHNRLDLSIVMVDTRTRRVIYRNRFTCYDRIGSPVYSIFSIADLLGILTSSVQSLWHLRPDQYQETLEEAAQQVAQAIPAPTQELPQGRAVKLQDVKVTAGQILGPDARVTIEVRATPACQGSYSIGTLVRDLPLREKSPGMYVGSYTVRRGDDTPYAVVELRLRPPRSNEVLEYTANERPFAIDTQPPPRARVARWWHGFLSGGVHLAVELNLQDQQKNNETPAEYYFYRRSAGHTRFEAVGISAEPTFHDRTAMLGIPYEYYVVTRDQAGNFSSPWEVVRVQERAKQPQ